MNAIKLNIKLETDSLIKNPEILPFIGKNVEIILIEDTQDIINHEKELENPSFKDDPFVKFLTDPDNFQNDKENITDISENHDKYIY